MPDSGQPRRRSEQETGTTEVGLFELNASDLLKRSLQGNTGQKRSGCYVPSYCIDGMRGRLWGGESVSIDAETPPQCACFR